MGPGALVAGKYQILEAIGRGGSSDVYRAHARHLDRAVALKVQRPDPAHDARTRWLRECRMLARLTHPSIVQVYELGQLPDGRLAMSLELVSGRALRAILSERGALPRAEVVGLGIQLLSALRAVHAAGIVHRDIKPGNLVVVSERRGPRLKLIDFGAAKPVGEGERSITRPTDVVGTPGYLAPEQLATGAVVDARTDLFAVGIVLFEALTGERPYGDRDVGVLLAAEQGVPRRLLALLEGCSTELRGILQALLSIDPADRPESASHALATLLGTPEADELPRSSTLPPPRKKVVVVAASSPQRRALWSAMVERAGGHAVPVAHLEAAVLLAETSNHPVLVLFDRSTAISSQEREAERTWLQQLTDLPATKVRLCVQVLRSEHSREVSGTRRTRLADLVMPLTEPDVRTLLGD